MRPLALALLVLSFLIAAGCAVIVREPTPPGKAKHADGPGHSENAPGQKKK